MTALVVGALSGVCAAFFTLFGVLITNRWRIAEENITKQRAEWRDAVRSIISQAVSNEDSVEARRLWAELALRMNPQGDPEKDDRELIWLMRSLERESERTDEVRGRIVDLAAHILKHDWTRAKWEANGWFWEDEPEQNRFLAPVTGHFQIATGNRS